MTTTFQPHEAVGGRGSWSCGIRRPAVVLQIQYAMPSGFSETLGMLRLVAVCHGRTAWAEKLGVLVRSDRNIVGS